MSVITLVGLVWAHFVADFLLQSQWMAENKSKSNKALLAHVGVYTLVLAIVFSFKFALINGIFHFITDYITSRMTTKLWIAKNYRGFFKVIGLDQAIHLTTLILTF